MFKRLFILLMAVSQIALAQQTLTPELLWKLNRVSNPQQSPDGQSVFFEMRKYDLSKNKSTNYICMQTSGDSYEYRTITENAFDAQWRPDGKKINFLSAESGSVQLYEINPDGTAKMQVTRIAGGINGYKISPDLKHIAFCADVKLDQAVNELYPDLPFTKARIADGLFYRHWDAWHDNAYSHIFIGELVQGKMTSQATDIMQGERVDAPLQPFGGDEQFNWSPDGKILAYTSRKLNGTAEAVSTNSDIYLYNLQTKQTTNFTASMPGYDTDPQFSPDGSKMAWTSMERAGNESDKNRLMVYYFATKTKVDVTRDFDYTTQFFQWNKQGTALYWISVFEGTKNIYFATEQAGKSGLMFSAVKALTQGDHDYLSFSIHSKSNSNFRIIGAQQRFSYPTELYAVFIDGVERQISNTNRELLKDVHWGKVEKRWVNTTDNKKMLVWVFLPPGFDASKKYPALLYCQGGPQSPVSQFFSYRWNFQLMASKGYIVVAPNRRGLPGFGSAWNDQITGDYGGQCMQDLLSAIDDVSKEPYVDKARLGAVGASFGGYSVYWLAGNHRNRFKTFISHCGMFNMESWYGSTEEMWFANNDNKGPYWQSPKPENFKASPHLFVQNWNTPILIIHNEKDFRVPLNQGMEAFNAAQLKGLKSKFLCFPDENHWVTKPQNSIVWQRVFFDWLDSTLK